MTFVRCEDCGHVCGGGVDCPAYERLTAEREEAERVAAWTRATRVEQRELMGGANGGDGDED